MPWDHILENVTPYDCKSIDDTLKKSSHIPSPVVFNQIQYLFSFISVKALST